MKTKKITKKLSLNKKTVADLNHGELKNAQGGYGPSVNYSNCLACTHSCGGTCLNTCHPSDCPTGDPWCGCPVETLGEPECF